MITKESRQRGRRLIHKHQKRIEANDQSGLRLRAVIEVAPRENVLREAQRLDQMRDDRVRPTSVCVPVRACLLMIRSNADCTGRAAWYSTIGKRQHSHRSHLRYVTYCDLDE